MTRILTLVLAVVLLAAPAVPAASATALADAPASSINETPTNGTDANESDGATVTVGAGSQLSTVITTAETDVRTEYEHAAFEIRYERDPDERAVAVADRARELRQRARSIRAEYESVTKAYERGDLSREEYAQRLAELNARAEGVLESTERLDRRAQNVSELNLRAAGLNQSAVGEIETDLEGVTGAGPSALLARFTGQTRGAVELRVENGLSIEVESEDGERSREIRRPRDDDTSIRVPQTAALDAARDTLSSQEGTWSLTKASVHEDDGDYRFEFRLANATVDGTTEVRVDGSTGEVYRVEEEIEPRDEDDERGESGDGDEERSDEDEDEGSDDELTLLVAEGEVTSGATITLEARAGGSPVADVPVTVDDERVGTTDEDGRISVTLTGEETKIRADDGDREGELEFEFEASEDPVLDGLEAGGSVENDTARLTVEFDGEPVTDATVYVDEQSVGQTGSDGAISFAVTDPDDVEVAIALGQFAVETAFEVQGSELVRTEAFERTDDFEDKEDGGEEDDEENEENDEEDDDEEDEEDDDGDDEEDDDGDDDDGDDEEDDDDGDDDDEEDDDEDDDETETETPTETETDDGS